MNPSPTPQVLLLDLGNVTVRLNFDRYFGRLGAACVPQRALESLRGMLEDPALGYADYERGFLSGPAWHALLRERLGLGLDYAAWLGLWQDVFEPNPGIEAVVLGLRGRVRVWGLSNTNPEHLQHLRRTCPILGAFEGITASHEVRARKPQAAIYAAALRSLGVEGSQVLYLDDIAAYVRAAETFGMRGFHYTFNDADLRRTLLSLGLALPPGPETAAPR